MDSQVISRLSKHCRLLTIGNKKLRLGDSFNYLTAGLTLAPAWESGKNTCAFHSDECAKACLYFSGMGRFEKTQTARKRRTDLFFTNRPAFMRELHADIWLVTQVAERLGATPAIRLNVTSDILWERYNVPQDWPGVQFYDYTKVPARRGLPLNYHLTFSFSGHNLDACKLALSNGMNVAVPFKKVPERWFTYRTLDGDAHDLRFLDQTPYVVALKPKGRLRSLPHSLFLGDNHNAATNIKLQGF